MTATTPPDESKALFLDSMADTGRLTYALKAAGWTHSQYKRIIENDESFAQLVNDAREYAIEKEFDSIADALTLYPNPYAAKVFSDNAKWRLTKMQPERFSDRLDIRNTHAIDLTDRFRAALDRLQDARRQTPSDALSDTKPAVLDAEKLDKSDTYSVSTSDKQSD